MEGDGAGAVRTACTLAMAALVGCATPRPEARGEGPRFHAEPARADPSLRLDAAAMFPTRSSTTLWHEVEPGGSDFEWTLVAESDGLTLSREGAHRAMQMRVGPSGGREATRVDKPADDARTLFDPPLPLCPAQLRGGEPFESTAAVRLVRLVDGSERDRGTATRRTELVGLAMVECPMLGRAEAMEVRTSLQTRLGLAQASIESTRWVHPALGPVAERTEERVNVMGLPVKAQSRLVVRIPGRPEHPDAAATEAP